VQPGSRALCTFGGGSIDKNDARPDAQTPLEALHCTISWEGGICANPESDRLLEITTVVKATKPDLLLTVGGRSAIDGAKFISAAALLPEDNDAWETLMADRKFPDKKIDFGCVLTLPATDSEWNSHSVLSRRSISAKQGSGCALTFPVFS
jgi:alcohol dehydrogenase YqhD (iron-dependent ADH family)